ncbi:MAG: hypothetical protein AAAB35_24870 [Phyllobacterium sp.]|uniref:hypothetical protein n=1 Tax=Phyllobacterium sp. TaxID=1871046 RepID=UPI0030EFF10D
MTAPAFDILKACDDENLFAKWFRDKKTWAAWRAFLAALFGLEMDEEQLSLYRQHTGRQDPPTTHSSEAWLVVGRRGGKSFHMALIATYLATFRDYRQYLQQGERATIAVIAADRKQARVIMRYVRALLTQIPILSKTIQKETAESFDLTGRVTIEVTTASQRSTRGYTYAAVLADEIAFWNSADDAADPDYAILDAIRPGMATIPGALLLCASSPYARRGALWDAYRRYWPSENQNPETGFDTSPLVWKATTREMNPTVPQRLIDEAMERDPASARAEYLAEFRADLEALLTREAVRACVVPGARELLPARGHRYFAFVDPSGGSSDSMTLGIAHRELSNKTAMVLGGQRGTNRIKEDEDDNWTVVLDCVREVAPPFSPENVVEQFCKVIKSYGLSKVTGDRYAGEWPRERFKHFGVTYEVAENTRSDLYLNLVPSINSQRIRLLDLPRLENQLISLERRTTRVGRDLVDHPPGGHDDLANAAAGALLGALDAARRGAHAFSIDMTGKVVFRDENKARVWQRNPGISGIDGVQYETWKEAHRAAGLEE